MSLGASGGGPALTPPTGWHALDGASYPLNQTSENLYAFYALGSAVSAGTQTWSWTGGHQAAVCIVGYTGVDNSFPFYPGPGSTFGTANTKGAAAAAITFASATPSATGAYPVLLMASQNTTGTTTISTPSTGFTTEVQNCSTSTSFNMAAILDQHSAINIPNAAFTPGNTTQSRSAAYASVTVFLRPDTSGLSGLNYDFLNGQAPHSSPVTMDVRTPHADQTCVLLIAVPAASSTVTVSGTTLSWSQIVDYPVGGITILAYAAFSASALTSSEQVTITSTSGTITAELVSFTNGQSANPTGATNTATAATGTPTVSLTTLYNSSRAVGLMVSGASTVAAGTDDIQNSTVGLDDFVAAGQTAVIASAGGTGTITAGSNPGTLYGAIIVEVSGSAAVVSIPLGSARGAHRYRLPSPRGRTLRPVPGEPVPFPSVTRARPRAVAAVHRRPADTPPSAPPVPAQVLQRVSRRTLAAFRRGRVEVVTVQTATAPPIVFNGSQRRAWRGLLQNRVRAPQLVFMAATPVVSTWPEIIFVHGRPAYHVSGPWYELA